MARSGMEPDALSVDKILRSAPGIDTAIVRKSGRSALHFACSVS